MRSAPFFLLTSTVCCALACCAASAQTTSPVPPTTAVERQAPGAGVEQRIERIRIEDDGSLVEEVRYGGQAQSITVTPKAPVPDYEIVPSDGPRSRSLSRDALSAAPGQRVWNALKF